MTAKKTYKYYAKFYDIFTDNYSDDIDFYATLYQPDDKILEVGCGSGRVLYGLCEYGFTNLTGIDISPEMLALAQIRLSDYIANKHVKLQKHDLMQASLSEKYDVILMPYYIVNYIINHPMRLFESVWQTLNPHGRLIIDCYYPYSIAYPQLENTWQIVKVDNYSEPLIIKDKRTMYGDIEKRTQIFQTNNIKHKVKSTRRFFPFKKIQSILESIGFINIVKQEGTTQFTNILSRVQYDDISHIPLNFLVAAEKK